METYSRTGNNYSVDTYKEFVLLSRSGLSKNEIFRRLKEKNPKLTIVHIDNWFTRFTPDLLPSETQLKYQKIYNDDVSGLVSQIEIFDQAIINKYKASELGELSSYLGKNDHSKEAIELVEEFVEVLQDIPDGCAELFPFDMIDELTEEYL